jgi:hypothetical protein
MNVIDKFARWLSEEPSIEQKVAAAAMLRAGRVWNKSKLRLEDIGLLVYHGTAHPKICRTSDIPTDATHIRPFIVLNQPSMPQGSGHGLLQFVLRDESEQIRYHSQGSYTMHQGKNFITSRTWLPLAHERVGGKWLLEVGSSSTRFAVHVFDWLEVGGELRTLFNGDGEIDTQSLQSMKLRGLDQVSLDELLAVQKAQTADEDRDLM